ncbi:MAG: Alanine dehydrogenase [Cytophagaceae bacterium]|jgi:alanine dehydrogenase|nr:Alanine dehydrogenase [Cytophagaceae bacterium]
MKIGIPKEIKQGEYRVSTTPGGVKELSQLGHQVQVEKHAGAGSGFTDEDYRKAGASIVDTAEEIYANNILIVKVKEPLATEYPLLKEQHILFTYLHLASSLSLTQALMKSGSTCIAYETVEKNDRCLPLLAPMSEVAGRMATQQGAWFLEKQNGGKGVLLGGVPGIPAAKVVVLGGGTVGTQAARIAAGMGAQVSILDVNFTRLRYLDEVMPKNVQTIVSNQAHIELALQNADLIIGAVLVPGDKAPVIVSAEQIKTLAPGTVVVDVAIDQGGCIETTRATSHKEPVYEVNGVLHYCVPNMPGAVPRTSTMALSAVTLPYIKQIADKGWEEATKANPELAKGLNVVKGKVVYEAVAKAFGI